MNTEHGAAALYSSKLWSQRRLWKVTLTYQRVNNETFPDISNLVKICFSCMHSQMNKKSMSLVTVTTPNEDLNWFRYNCKVQNKRKLQSNVQIWDSQFASG
mmetsp:Transcript_53509/g.111680  ORF Transcript_53509/g.111680 Transcript_53509/m.111680 type:complete len:101 (-) Transcript_53509:99-401(-)